MTLETQIKQAITRVFEKQEIFPRFLDQEGRLIATELMPQFVEAIQEEIDSRYGPPMKKGYGDGVKARAPQGFVFTSVLH